MAYTQFKTMASGSPKTDNDTSGKDIRSRQIDELIRLSETERRETYGPNWDQDCKDFYNLFEGTSRIPSYRPRIKAPQLQLLLLQEAAEATDTNIRVYIHKKDQETGTARRRFRSIGSESSWACNF